MNDGLNEEQLQAVKLATSGIRALALTGGAGTGKTRTLAAIARAAAAIGKSVRVMAFSGKAAMRAEEAMREGNAGKITCSTIHRALKLQGTFRMDDEKLPESIVVLDEASMIPNWLLAEVIKALQPNATLMLVGDPNQLPPIGYGAPFQDYLSLWLPSVHLVKNYRQANQQSIFNFAEAIRTQNPDKYTPSATGVQTHYDIDPEDESFFDAIIRNCATLGLHEWQVVTWTNNIQQALNMHLQNLINPSGNRLFSYPCWDLRENGYTPRADIRVGDKVIVTDNDYDYEVFNGQTGIITHATFSTLTLDLGHRQIQMKTDDAYDLLQLGYVITVHKSQGSGWEAVIVYQPFEVKFQPRRFYYTSATRAKNQLYLITTMSEHEFWRNACEDDNSPPSTLIRRIKSKSGDLAA
jgi:exodeoxyribonuclease V alpha subunit